MRNKLILLVQLTWLVDTSSNKTETATNLVARRKTFEDNKNSTSINLGKKGKKKKIKAARKMVAGKPQKNVDSTTENVGKKKTKKAARKMIAEEKIKQKTPLPACVLVAALGTDESQWQEHYHFQ